MKNNEELSIQKRELVSSFSKMVTEIEYEFLQNKLFQPIGIELSTVPVILETEETHSFKGVFGKDKDALPLAFYRPDTDSIHIFIEHISFQKRKTYVEKYNFLLFLLYHEAGHRLFMTMDRQNERDMELWNIATDLEIHNMYYVYSSIVKSNYESRSISTGSNFYEICKYIDTFLIDKTNKDEDLNEGLFEKDYLNYVAEEIYQDLLNSKVESKVSYTFDQNGNMISESKTNSNSSKNNKNKKDNNKWDEGEDEDSKENDKSSSGGTITVTISEYTLPSGKKIKTSNVDCSNLSVKPKTKEEQENEKNGAKLRATILENTVKEETEKQRARGLLSSECKEFLKKMFHIKIDWKKILRNSLQTVLEKADYFSWSRPRVSLYGMPNAPYLPSQCMDAEKYGVLVVARDESGSMSDNEIAKAAGIIADAKEHYKKIIIIKHDYSITSINEFEELNDNAKKILLSRESYGGTSHKEVFKWIEEYYAKNRDTENAISCFISITDMESDIENFQDGIPSKVPTIYICPEGCNEHHKSVKGVIIPVEI